MKKVGNNFVSCDFIEDPISPGMGCEIMFNVHVETWVCACMNIKPLGKRDM
jgi:hypothetical protein